MIISKIKRKKISYVLIIVGNVQFIILTIIAMFFYKGGTYIDNSTQAYLFWYNYFSDLGRTVAHSGIPNIVSWILFTVALSLWGILQIPFFIAFPHFFSSSKNLRMLSLIGSTFGVFAGVCYIGIAFTPSNLLDNWHDIFVFLGFGSIFLSNILYSVVIFLKKDYSKFYAKILIISVVILSTYFLILAFTRNINIATKLFICVLGQKLMMYSILICGILQGYGAIRQER
ncbi:MAG: hypothetical protein ACFFG0_36045 [Candidatus Thorarchaeota archaeon]